MNNNRIHALLKQNGKRKLLIPFFTVGYPSVTGSRELIEVAIDSGADMVELGIPFSDPLADGPSVQYSSHLSLANGTTLETSLQLARKVRSKSDIPLIMMGYYNPIYRFGAKGFCRRAQSAGVDGLIIPDLPVEESRPIKKAANAASIGLTFLVAPTSPVDRIRSIDKLSTDFVYAVTITGVTGQHKTVSTATEQYLESLSKTLTKPYVAGFGVSSPATAVTLARHADGVVIGSALIEIIRKAKSFSRAKVEVATLLKNIRRALDRVS